MATMETGCRRRRLVRAHRRAARAARARARVRGEGDPAEGGRVRRAADAPRRHHREGARARPDEPPRPRALRRPRALGVRRDARRRGAQLGLLRHRHVDGRERPRRRPRAASPAPRSRRTNGCRRSLEEPILCSFGLTEPGAGLRRRRHPDDGRAHAATSTSSTGRRRSSRTPASQRGRSSSPRPTARRATGASRAFIVPMDTPGVHDREAPRQDGPARERHRRDRVRGRARPGREPARRGGRRLQDRHADARLHAARHGRRRRRRRAGARYELAVEYAKERVHVRHADRDAPGRQLHDRRHGDEDRGGPAARLAGGLDDRPAASARTRSLVVRQALRGRHGDEGHDRRGAGLRRLRLHRRSTRSRS